MIYRDFIVEENENSGGVGFTPTFMRDGEPFGSTAMAHDSLEHTPEACRISGAEGELMAMGAMWLIRGISQYWSRRWHRMVAPEALIAADIAGLLELVSEGIQTLDDPGNTQRLGDIDEEALSRVVRLTGARQSISPTPEQRYRIRGWLRRGFRSAQRRYKGLSPDNLEQLFWDIERQAEAILRQKAQNEEELGARIRVEINLQAQQVRVYEVSGRGR